MTTTVGYNSLKVSLVRLEPKPFELAWRAFRETWLDLHDKDYDANDLECKEAVQDVLNRRALPIPMENWQCEFRVSGLSRVALAQITRGRLGQNYVVQSQMPQHISHECVVPLNITQSEFSERAAKLQLDAEKLYNDMYDAGVPPQDCRYLVLHGQTTSLVWTINYAALMSFFAMRAENGLTDELNLVCRLVRKAIVDYANENKETHGDWLSLAERLDCMGAWQRKCLNVDKVFGNAGRFESANARVPSPNSAVQPDYDFAKSAWYLELIKLYHDSPELLFAGEAEMVSRWLSGGTLCP